MQDAGDLEASDRILAVTGILRAVWQSCNVQAWANATKDMGLTGMDRGQGSNRITCAKQC